MVALMLSDVFGQEMQCMVALMLSDVFGQEMQCMVALMLSDVFALRDAVHGCTNVV